VCILLLLAAAGFGAWKFNAQREAAEVARHEAAETGRLRPYKVDPDTGALSQVEEWDRQSRGDDYLPPVGDFGLIDQMGRKITNQDLLGQPYAVSFLFTKCFGPCLDIRG